MFKKINLLFAFLCFAPSFYAQFERSTLDPALKPFYHGVASGDPLDDRVIIWTRVTPDSSTSEDIEVFWRVARDTGMTDFVTYGTTYTNEIQDFTVKVDVTGLDADTWYYFDFRALSARSIRGRTRTAPTGDVDSLRFAIVSCSNYEHGYFNAYNRIRDRNDVRAVIHLGDYIYEYGAGGYTGNIAGRDNEPTNEIITLEDYRIRHSHYKLDADLRRLHQQYPFMMIWDDHESANDSYKDGAENHDTGTEGDWTTRKGNSIQAYHEWLPTRQFNSNQQRIWKTINYGDLMNLVLLDTRLHGRDEQVGATSGSLGDTNRTMLGSDQYNWFIDQLDSSQAQWNIVANQVMFAPLEIFGVPVNTDQWDGYPAERGKIMQHVLSNNIDNFVVLTGDIHTTWANDIPTSSYNASNCTGSVGVEFVVTSVTSPGAPFSVPTSIVSSNNPHIQELELSSHGYMILDINKTRTQGDWYYVDAIDQVTNGETLGTAWYVNDQERCLNQASSPSQYLGPSQAFAPDDPLPAPALSVTETKDLDQLVFIGAYPNPTYDEVILQLFLTKDNFTSLEVVDIQGRTVLSNTFPNMNQGANYIRLSLKDLNPGYYNILLKSDQEVKSRKVLRLAR